MSELTHAQDEKPRPILDLFLEGYDIKTVADVHGCPDEHVENTLRARLAQVERERDRLNKIVVGISQGFDPLKTLVEGMVKVGEANKQLASERARVQELEMDGVALRITLSAEQNDSLRLTTRLVQLEEALTDLAMAVNTERAWANGSEQQRAAQATMYQLAELLLPYPRLTPAAEKEANHE